MKQILIAGNWKSNKTEDETKEWLEQWSQSFSTFHGKNEHITIVICAPTTVLHVLKEGVKTRDLPIRVGAQNVSAFADGAFTGEVSARMVKELADWVIIGHSERRTYQRETNEDLSAKVANAKNVGLRVIYCVPDSTEVIPHAVDVVAYEPIWAIGTGKTDTPENANSVCAEIKKKTGISSVIYGGSINATNVKQFISMNAIDGVLPGGASLDPQVFFRLVTAAGSTH